MKNKKRGQDHLLKIIGIFFILLGIGEFILAFYNGKYQDFFWFCYSGHILIGLGILFGNSYLILIETNILLIPLIIWDLDFFYILFTGNSIGVADYFFIEKVPLISNLISLHHLYTPLLLFFSLYIIKIKRKDAWKISFLQMTALFILVRMLNIIQTNNVDCAFHSCIPMKLLIPYEINWFIGAFLLVIITNSIITRISCLEDKKNQK